MFLTVTAIALWAVTLAAGWEPIPATLCAEATFALRYLGIVGSVIAFATYVWMLRRISLMTSTTLVFVIPIIALFVDALWEKEVHGEAGAIRTIDSLLPGSMVALVVGYPSLIRN